jgi:hypothetical protein
MSGNAAESRAGYLPNTRTDAALTPIGSVYSPEMKDWKYNDNDVTKIMYYARVHKYSRSYLRSSARQKGDVKRVP